VDYRDTNYGLLSFRWKPNGVFVAVVVTFMSLGRPSVLGSIILCTSSFRVSLSFKCFYEKLSSIVRVLNITLTLNFISTCQLLVDFPTVSSDLGIEDRKIIDTFIGYRKDLWS